MAVVEERLSLLEVKMQDVGATLIRMEGMLSSVHQMVVALDHRVVALDHRVVALDQRMVALDQRMDKLDQRVDRLELRIDKMDDRMLKLFLWVIGIQMTTLITIAGGLFALVAKLIPNP